MPTRGQRPSRQAFSCKSPTYRSIHTTTACVTSLIASPISTISYKNPKSPEITVPRKNQPFPSRRNVFHPQHVSQRYAAGPFHRGGNFRFPWRTPHRRDPRRLKRCPVKHKTVQEQNNTTGSLPLNIECMKEEMETPGILEIALNPPFQNKLLQTIIILFLV